MIIGMIAARALDGRYATEKTGSDVHSRSDESSREKHQGSARAEAFILSNWI